VCGVFWCVQVWVLQNTRLSYVVTGFLNKETSADREFNPIFAPEGKILHGQWFFSYFLYSSTDITL